MRCHHIKLVLALTIIVGYGQLITADTKVLSNINLFVEGATRDETIALENDKDLVVKGVLVERFTLPDDRSSVLTVIVEYVADKDGYRPKYKFVKETYSINYLNPSTLKSLGG